MAVDGRFSLIQTPQALPGTCAGCGKAKCDQGFIDTDLQFEYFGALIFCAECILDMASKMGYISPEAAERLQTQVNELEHEAATQREALLLLEEALDGIQTARNLLHPVPDNDGNDDTSEPTYPPITPPEISESESVVEGANSVAGSGNSEANDNSGEQESVRIPEPATSELADAASIGLDV